MGDTEGPRPVPRFYSYAEIGEKYTNYGRRTPENIGDIVEGLSTFEATNYLLAAVFRELRLLRREVEGTRSDRADERREAGRRRVSEAEAGTMADGMPAVLNAGRKTLVEQCDTSRLSGRARYALRNGRFRLLSDITRDRVAAIRNCGTGTWLELRDWVAAQDPGPKATPSEGPDSAATAGEVS